MRISCWIAAICALSGGNLSAQEKAAEPKAVQAAIHKGLDYLVGEGQAWIKGRKCAACHHVPMMVWTLHEASARGIKINDKALADAIEYMLAADNRAKIFPEPNPKEPMPKAPKLSLASVYTALSLNAGPKNKIPADGLDRLLTHMVKNQEADGSWAPVDGRAPMFGNREVITELVSAALAPHARENPQPKTIVDARDAASKWWSANRKDESHQALVLRLLLAKTLALPDQEWQPTRAELLKRQQLDGGWKQTAEMASDAYATGQSLYVLSMTGIETRAPAMRKGQAFLLKTQDQDGAWPMTSRPNKGDKGSKNTGPITYAGTAWGTMGLIRTLEVQVRKDPAK